MKKLFAAISLLAFFIAADEFNKANIDESTNKLLEKTNIKHEYTLFSTETITSQYHLYADRQKEIDICFDVDLNCNIKNIVNLKLYKHNYNRERIETNFTLSDYFDNKDEIIQNMEILGY